MKEKVGNSLNRSPRAAISVDTAIVATSRERERERKYLKYWNDRECSVIRLETEEGSLAYICGGK